MSRKTKTPDDDGKVEVVRQTLDDALESARQATGDTVLVLVSPIQAERLHLALQIADGVVLAESMNHSTGIKHRVWKRYKQLGGGGQ